MFYKIGEMIEVGLGKINIFRNSDTPSVIFCGFVVMVITLLLYILWMGNQLSKPATTQQILETRNHSWCANDTLQRRVEAWNMGSKPYVVVRSDLENVIRDCENLVKAIKAKEEQAAALKQQLGG